MNNYTDVSCWRSLNLISNHPFFFLFQGFHIEFDRLARLSVLSVLWLFNVHIIPTIFYIYYIYIIYYMIYSKHLYTGLPLKLEKNMIFWRKIVIFHTKYREIFRASLRSAQFFYVRLPPLTWNPGSAPGVSKAVHTSVRTQLT